MKSARLAVPAVIVLLSGVAVGAAAQTGVNVPPFIAHDSAPAWLLFAPNAKSTVPGQQWTVTPPAARVAEAARTEPNAIRCPMAVFAPDTSKQDRMPVAREDSSKVERIPVAKSGCVNPLENKPRP